jgi:hypothetical protein
MAKNTLDMVGKFLAEDKATAEKRSKSSKDAPYYPMNELRERLEIRKADAGGLILCWYGPNGSREVIVKDASEAVPIMEKFFSGEDPGEADDADEE